MKARDFYVRTARTYWRRGGYLLLLGVAVFVPLGLLEALADRAADIDLSNPSVSSLSAIALVAGIALQAVTSLIGEVFYAGAVALALAGGERSTPPGLRTVARKLAYWKLIAVDIVFGLATAVGLLLLVVPGVVFFTWFALAGPVVELEGTGVRAALARSRRLVRGRFWTVLLVLLPITVGGELLTEAVLGAVHLAVHDPILGAWAGEAVANILLSPFYAVAAVLMTLDFSRADG